MITARRASAALAAVAVLGMAACDAPSQATPPPTPSVVPTLPPSASTKPTPSATNSTADLVAQAEAVYRKQAAVQDKMFLAGGVPRGKPAPKELTAVAEGDAVTWIMDTMAQIHEKGITNVSGEAVITKVEKYPQTFTHEGSIVTLHSCEDGTSLVNKLKDGSKSHGMMTYVVTTYKMVNGTLKMNFYDDSKTVTTCPIK